MTYFTCYAIRDKSTGYFLPMRWNKSSGFSHDEPEPGFPRLFPSKESARNALSSWRNYGGGWHPPEYNGCLEPSPIPERLERGMEIVEMTLAPSSPELNLYLQIRLLFQKVGEGEDQK